MKILLVNDDGIEAPGLQALYDSIVGSLMPVSRSSVEIVVVAPHCGRSECGHSVTTGRPLQVDEIRAGWFSVDGTPVDCVRLGLGQIHPHADCVISGINAGANLGIDLLVSGTFAAAREAALHGRPAMAISHYRRPDVPVTWDHVPRWLQSLIPEFLAASKTHASNVEPPSHPESRAALERETTPPTPLWNVNLPAIDPLIHIPETRECTVDPTPLQRAYFPHGKQVTSKTDFHGRPRVPHSDVSLCFAGYLTVSKLAPNYW